MMVKIIITIAAVILGMGGMAGGSAVDSNSIVLDSIEYYMQTDKSVYNLGEEVQMLYRVTNLGNEDVTFEFTAGPVNDRGDFIVEENGESIWNNLGRPRTRALTQFTLSSLEYKDFNRPWDMTDLSGNQVVAGNYDVTGVLGNLSYQQRLERYIPVSVSIEIIPEPAMIYYIDADANGLNDGSSWADAYNFLQDALADADSGDEIWVAQGTYKPDQGVGITPGDRSATFQVKNGVAIKGGYAGFGQPDPNARDIEAYETILSGDLYGNDIQVVNPEDLPGQPSRAENSYQVVTVSDCNQTTVLDGFTITAGNANQDHPSLYVNGGGMFNWDSSSPTVTNCTFSENSAAGSGGGMFNFWESSPTLTNCTFSGNSAEETGAGMSNWRSSPTLTNCTFSENSAYYYGGGMCNYEYSSPTVSNCKFSSNSAEEGGGMCNNESSPTLTNCIFNGNTADYGGGMCNGGGSPTLTNCTFSGNSVSRGGGGMFSNASNPTLTNCTFSSNSAEEGGGMFSNASNPTLTNCILWGDTPEEISVHGRAPVITYSDVQGGWPGEGNIDGAPRFGVPGSWELIEGMDSHWKLDGNAYDSAGVNQGTVYGNPVWTIGQLGGALDLDGTGDYVNCGNDSSLNLTNNFSISAWFNLDSAGPVILLCKGNVPAYFPGGAYTILCVPSNGTLSFYIRGSNNTEFGCAVAAVAINEWTHIVGTFNDGNISIYKNGVFVESTSLGTPTIHSNDGPLGIGAEGDGGMPFKGTIDEVAIHNRALSGEEIQKLYQIGLNGHSYYHLLPDSPCIDAGDPNYVPEPNETDLDGRPRVIGGRIDMGAYEYSPTISAEVRIVPRSLNLPSEGKWITCYIWLPEDCEVGEIEPNSVFLDDEIQAESLRIDEQQQVAIARFSRSGVQGILAPGEVELTVSGELTEGTRFEGTDIIRVIDKVDKK